MARLDRKGEKKKRGRKKRKKEGRHFPSVLLLRRGGEKGEKEKREEKQPKRIIITLPLLLLGHGGGGRRRKGVRSLILSSLLRFPSSATEGRGEGRGGGEGGKRKRREKKGSPSLLKYSHFYHLLVRPPENGRRGKGKRGRLSLRSRKKKEKEEKELFQRQRLLVAPPWTSTWRGKRGGKEKKRSCPGPSSQFPSMTSTLAWRCDAGKGGKGEKKRKGGLPCLRTASTLIELHVCVRGRHEGERQKEERGEKREA